jgi:hypothetical protein
MKSRSIVSRLGAARNWLIQGIGGICPSYRMSAMR